MFCGRQPLTRICNWRRRSAHEKLYSFHFWNGGWDRGLLRFLVFRNWWRT